MFLGFDIVCTKCALVLGKNHLKTDSNMMMIKLKI